LHEFFAIATHPGIYAPPTPRNSAIDQIDAWPESPTLALLAEPGHYWPTLRAIMQDGQIAGPAAHDARIAAICLQHGVTELWSADRDFNRFPQQRTHNPLVTIR